MRMNVIKMTDEIRDKILAELTTIQRASRKTEVFDEYDAVVSR